MPHKDPEARREYQRAYQSKWRQENREKWLDILRRCAKKRWHGSAEIRRAHMDYKNHRRQILRTIALDKYGGKCVCCGESTFEFLTFDHKYEDGAAKRRAGKDEFKSMVKLLIHSPLREDIQVLCCNCNHAKHFYNGCPHQDKKEES